MPPRLRQAGGASSSYKRGQGATSGACISYGPTFNPLRFTSVDNFVWYEARANNKVLEEADLDPAFDVDYNFWGLFTIVRWVQMLDLPKVYYPGLA